MGSETQIVGRADLARAREPRPGDNRAQAKNRQLREKTRKGGNQITQECPREFSELKPTGSKEK